MRTFTKEDIEEYKQYAIKKHEDDVRLFLNIVLEELKTEGESKPILYAQKDISSEYEKRVKLRVSELVKLWIRPEDKFPLGENDDKI